MSVILVKGALKARMYQVAISLLRLLLTPVNQELLQQQQMRVETWQDFMVRE
jgi:hypothetical protein